MKVMKVMIGLASDMKVWKLNIEKLYKYDKEKKACYFHEFICPACI